jgi:predicted unusual protein kinase regulating ubiquinone biosynthesis (AarF/ABC1/UbiB family)
LVDAPQETRDAAMHRLIHLVLRELFEFGVMQTDPNFANYFYQPYTGRLVLLDFGASRPVAAATADGYRNLLRALTDGDGDAALQFAFEAGFVGERAIQNYGARIGSMIAVIIDEMSRRGPFDFGDRRFVGVLRDEGLDIAADRGAWHIPPADILFVQRKISGTALLAARLKARVDVRGLLAPYLSPKNAVSFANNGE